MRNRRIKFHPLDDAQSGPSVWTWIIPLLAGTAVYFAFAEKLEIRESHIIWWEELLEVAPAAMLILLFQVFVLFPLRMLFARGRMDSPLLFLALSMLIWIVVSALILRQTNVLPQDDLWVDASVIVPGLVVAVVYTLMNVYSTSRPHDVRRRH
jgi:hypothetical protein